MFESLNLRVLFLNLTKLGPFHVVDHTFVCYHHNKSNLNTGEDKRSADRESALFKLMGKTSTSPAHS